MKQLYFIFVVVLCMATGCGSKKDASGDSDQHIFQIDSVDRVTGVQRMQVSRTNQNIVCNGKKYRLFIDRSPSDSLKKVKSDAGILPTIALCSRLPARMGQLFFQRLLPNKILLPLFLTVI